MVWFTLILMIVDEIRMVDDAMKDEWNVFACCFIPGSNQTCSPQLVGPPICLLLLLHPIDILSFGLHAIWKGQGIRLCLLLQSIFM